MDTMITEGANCLPLFEDNSRLKLESLNFPNFSCHKQCMYPNYFHKTGCLLCDKLKYVLVSLATLFYCCFRCLFSPGLFSIKAKLSLSGWLRGETLATFEACGQRMTAAAPPRPPAGCRCHCAIPDGHVAPADVDARRSGRAAGAGPQPRPGAAAQRARSGGLVPSLALALVCARGRCGAACTEGVQHRLRVPGTRRRRRPQLAVGRSVERQACRSAGTVGAKRGRKGIPCQPIPRSEAGERRGIEEYTSRGVLEAKERGENARERSRGAGLHAAHLSRNLTLRPWLLRALLSFFQFPFFTFRRVPASSLALGPP